MKVAALQSGLAGHDERALTVALDRCAANYVEPARLLALGGARVLVCPLNNGLFEAQTGRWTARTHANLVARAVENDCWVIAADVCGLAGGRAGVGATRIVAPDGQVVAAAPSDQPDLLIADIGIAETSLLPRWDVRKNPAVLDAWMAAAAAR